MLKFENFNLFNRIKKCDIVDCGLHPSRGSAMQVVPGDGPINARIMFVGEGPGADEDSSGHPFIGKAGKLLTKMLSAVGIDRYNDIFITNIVKCRPPGNRDPIYQEIKCCEFWLQSQIGFIKPEVLVVIGRISKDVFIPSTPTITKCHGTVYDAPITLNLIDKGDGIIDALNVKVMPILHPSYIERNGGDRGTMFQDTIGDLENLIDLIYDPDNPSHWTRKI